MSAVKAGLVDASVRAPTKTLIAAAQLAQPEAQPETQREAMPEAAPRPLSLARSHCP